MVHERLVVFAKPDAVQRNLIGEIISRFERKGLKIVGLKMLELTDLLLDEHYAHHKEKPFFPRLKAYMQSTPVVAMILEGLDAVSVVRSLCGPTNARVADVGTIRGDLAMSIQSNIVHASETPEIAEQEIRRFFKPEELFTYQKFDTDIIYADDERAN